MTTGDSFTSTDTRRTAVVRHQVEPGRWAVDIFEQMPGVERPMVVMVTVPASYFDKGWTRNEKGTT